MTLVLTILDADRRGHRDAGHLRPGAVSGIAAHPRAGTPSLEFFKETLESKLGLETERGSLTFSLIKHLGLAVIGCLTLAAAILDERVAGKRSRWPACW